jgi:hypothetical protein
MERLYERIESLHRMEETAFIEGDQSAMRAIGEELDQIVTDEAVDAMKGDE